MAMRRRLSILIGISFLRTLRFNLHYFGLSGLRLPVLVGRKFRLGVLRGRVTLPQGLRQKIFLGRDDFGYMRSRGDWCNQGQVCFEGPCYIGNGTRISVGLKGQLTLGSGLYLSGEDLLICKKAISLGADSMLSWGVTVIDSDLHTILDENGASVNPPSPVRTGQHTWIGFEARLLKGANIPDGCIIAAGSTISKPFHEPNCLLGGINQQLRTGVFWQPQEP